ncbi:MAG: GNAT family N-acetyltransferase [Gaiellaceae bacterium]
MRIREIDTRTATEELLLELYAVEGEVDTELSPDEPPWPFEDALSFYRHPGEGVRRRWIASVDDEIVAMATLNVYGPSFVFANVAVRRRDRRHGMGRALLDVVVDAARGSGVRAIMGHHATPEGAAFARAAGGRDDQRDVRSVLDLRAAVLPAPQPPAGTELLTWIGACPDDLLESYTRARQAMNDAPVPDGSESPDWTAERQRSVEGAAVDRGRPPRVTVALERGEVVAFTDVRVSAPPVRRAATDDTATVPAARGRGLARAVKLESLRLLRDERPDVEVVITMNAEQNHAMRHINTQLGFVPTATMTTTVVTL